MTLIFPTLMWSPLCLRILVPCLLLLGFVFTPISHCCAFWRELSVPLTTRGAYPFLLGSMTTAGTIIYEKKFLEQTHRYASTHKPLGQYSQYGDLLGQIYPNVFYFLMMSLYGFAASSSYALDNAAIMAKATFYSSLVAVSLKYTVQEERPNGSNLLSFPSGHTTTAFAFAGAVGARHSWPVGFMAYSMAAFVGYSRMNDNAHWMHDVMAGATLGTSYGVGIASLYNRSSSRRAKNLFIQPFFIPDGAMLLSSFQF